MLTEDEIERSRVWKQCTHADATVMVMAHKGALTACMPAAAEALKIKTQLKPYTS